ncbi:ankyrin repeat domain-containing protein [Streptomyces endophyticus]|uniref:Ankyrin repeat domain-containing protein n=1 Tax=Streptomyces endophyticus TaxID=714166 RepID=A0ABU6F8E5_9ACTN|nr:ankyrin repeat domain-containing protein [Streptomyces endophyticus]MEB8339763.1 ankyrin repeat domain-containing protein [Streptomyces endophyticus]
MHTRRLNTRLCGLIAVGALAFVTACTAAPDDGSDTRPSKGSSSATAERPESPKSSAALLRAADEGDTDAVRAALRAGADTEVRDDEGRTPLLLAALADQVAAAKVLVAAGADPDAQDEQDDSAWLVTGVTGSVAMARALVPADPDYALLNRYGGTSLIPAGEHGHAAYVREVLRSTDVDVDHVNNLGWTALLEAIILGDGGRDHQQVVSLLLDGGADPELADRDGVTPLAHAERHGYDEIAKLLRNSP